MSPNNGERKNEYDDVFVTRLGLIWGEGFLSPGGAEEVRTMLGDVVLEGRDVLDIGCGVGGVDVLLAKEHGARVLGIDIEQPLLEKARARAQAAGVADQIEFRLVDPGPLQFPDASFDAVFSKDAILQIPDIGALFIDIHRVLRPGGVFIASDWLKSSKPETPALDEYIAAAEYTAAMSTPEDTQAFLEAAGFTDVHLTDRTDWLLEDSRKTHTRIVGSLKERAIELIGEQRYQRWVRISAAVVGSLEARDMVPIHIYAKKPEA